MFGVIQVCCCITRVEDHFQEKDDELSRNSFQGYMQVEYEAFPFCEHGHQEESMNQVCENIDENLIIGTMEMGIKDRLEVREDETSSSHPSSCMKPEFEAFKFTSGDYNEENIVMASRTKEVLGLEEMCCDLMIEECEDEGINDDALLKEFSLHQYQLMINSPNQIDSLEDVRTKMETMIVSSLSDLMGEEEEIHHGKIQCDKDVHSYWNNFIENTNTIIPVEKKECLVSEINSGIHDDQSIEFQVEGLSSREKDHKCIQELESLILQIFQNVVINDMRH